MPSRSTFLVTVTSLVFAALAVACGTATPRVPGPATGPEASTLPRVDRADKDWAPTLMTLANRYHRAGQALRDAKLDYRPTYRMAAGYYARFLERYPDHQKSYVLHFFYGELLFELGEYSAAAEQYERALARDTAGELVEDAALGIVYALDRATVRPCSGRPRIAPWPSPDIRPQM